MRCHRLGQQRPRRVHALAESRDAHLSAKGLVRARRRSRGASSYCRSRARRRRQSRTSSITSSGTSTSPRDQFADGIDRARRGSWRGARAGTSRRRACRPRRRSAARRRCAPWRGGGARRTPRASLASASASTRSSKRWTPPAPSRRLTASWSSGSTSQKSVGIGVPSRRCGSFSMTTGRPSTSSHDDGAASRQRSTEVAAQRRRGRRATRRGSSTPELEGAHEARNECLRGGVAMLASPSSTTPPARRPTTARRAAAVPGRRCLGSTLFGPVPGSTWIRLWPGETSWYCSRASRIAADLESIDLACSREGSVVDS